jgi:hypothetical protein
MHHLSHMQGIVLVERMRQCSEQTRQQVAEVAGHPHSFVQTAFVFCILHPHYNHGPNSPAERRHHDARPRMGVSFTKLPRLMIATWAVVKRPLLEELLL